MAAPFAEFAGNKRLLWIAEEWKRSADALAEWAMERLVNRRDVWSQYTRVGDEVSVVMLPIPERRKLGTDMVTLDKLRRHFAGRSGSHLIGLHSISDHSTCKWFAIDVDLHDETLMNADESALANLTACLEWSAKLQKAGLDPLLMDSNGVGGFHIWVLLDQEYPLAEVHHYVSEMRNDYGDYGLPRKPEVFPPKAEVEDDDLPYGLRLPGRHYSRPHYTRVWNFDPVVENEWLEGGDAIEAMLSARPSKLPVTLSEPTLKRIVKKPRVKQKTRVALDLDGVLAKYEGWDSFGQIGPPLPGALAFANELAEIADIVIFTGRCSLDAEDRNVVAQLSPGQMRIRVIDWLEKHKFPFIDVYIGQGKPHVAAFIDDRAVACRPQTDQSAFENAIGTVRSLLRKGQADTKSKTNRT